MRANRVVDRAIHTTVESLRKADIAGFKGCLHIL